MSPTASQIDWNNPSPQYWRGAADALDDVGMANLPPDFAERLRRRAENARVHAKKLEQQAAAAAGKPIVDSATPRPGGV